MATNNSGNFEFSNDSDGFTIKGGTTERALTLTGADITMTGSGTNTYTYPSASDTLVGRASTDDLSNKSLGNDLDWNSNGVKITSQTVGGNNGDLVYLSSANTWSQADADAEATCSSALGLRISATEVLTIGVYTTTGLTAGSTYYASTTAGGITTTAPSGTGDIVRIVGYALSTTEFFFKPDGTFIEVS